MSRIAGSEHRGRDPRLPAPLRAAALDRRRRSCSSLLPFVVGLAARPRSRLPGADHLAAAAAGNLAGAGGARARPARRSRRRPAARPVDAAVDGRPSSPSIMSTAGSACATIGWTGCSPPRRSLFHSARRLVHCPADGQRRQLPGDGAAARAVDPRLSARGPARPRARPLAAGAMKRALAAAARRSPRAARRRPSRAAPSCSARCQAGVAALLAGADGLYRDRRERALSAASPRATGSSMRLIPPRRGWIVDRHGQPIAINRSDFRVDLIPDQLEDADRVIAELARILGLAARRGRADPRRARARRPASSRCRSPSI